MKLEIASEKVLEAASKCSTAKEVLQILFPKAFKSGKKRLDTISKDTDIFYEKISSASKNFNDMIQLTISNAKNDTCFAPPWIVNLSRQNIETLLKELPDLEGDHDT